MAQRKPKYIKIHPQPAPVRGGDFTEDTLPPNFSAVGDRVIRPPVNIKVNKSAKDAAGHVPQAPRKMKYVAKKR